MYLHMSFMQLVGRTGRLGRCNQGSGTDLCIEDGGRWQLRSEN